MAATKAKAPAGTGASQPTTRYFDHHHHSRPERRRQHSRTLDDFVVDEAEMSPFGPADLLAAGAGAVDLTDRVIERVGRAVGRRVRRSPQWEHARQLALRLVVTLWRASPSSTAGPEDEDTTARIASQALARRLLAEVEAAGAEVVAVLAAVVLAVVLASTPAPTPATCRGSARRRRRRRAAAACVRARAARKGAGCHARPRSQPMG